VVEKTKIAQLVNALDHPDGEHRRAARQKLVDLGSEAIPVLHANLELVDADARPPLIRVLREIGDRRSLLPLMRFVFDERGNIEESDARALAMQAIIRIGPREDPERLFEFLLDIRNDEDPHVRGYAAEGFGRIGDPDVEPFVEEALEDSDDFVRECAQRATEALESSDSDPLESTLDAREILRKIRMADSSELEYYVSELLERDDAFDLAVQMVREEHRDTTRGLRILMRLGDSRARDIARRRIRTSSSSAVRATALRLLADHLSADADGEEVDLIREGLDDTDSFVALAALEAAGKSGEPSLVRETLRAVESSDLSRAEDAAGALAGGLTPSVQKLIPDLIDALERIRRHRRHETDPTYVSIEAYLLRALRRVVSGDSMADRDAQEQALLSLRDAANNRPIVVTALELLDSAVPEDGLEPVDRWSAPEAVPLVELLESSDDAVVRRVLHLVERAVSAEIPEIREHLSRLVYRDEDVLLDAVVPILGRSGDARARKILRRLEDHSSDAVAEAATDALDDL